MTRIARAVLTCMALVVLAGCWPHPGQNASRTGFNDLENLITPANVGTLTQAWVVTEDVPGVRTAADPIVSHHGVHVVYSGCMIATYRPADGSRRWLRVPTPSFCESAGTPPHQYSPAFVVGERVTFGAWANSSGTEPPVFIGGGGTFDAATGAPAGRGVSTRIVAGVRGEFLMSTRPVHDADGVPRHNAVIVVERWEGGGPPLRIVTPGGGLPVLGDHAVFRSGFGTLATGPGDPAVGEGVRAFARTPVRSRCGGMTCPVWATPTDGGATVPVLSRDQSTVYVGTDAGTVYALDAASGAVQWTFATDGSIWASPALADGVLFVVTLEGTLYALDVEACRSGACAPRWTASAGSRPAVQPAVAGGVVFTGDGEGFVRAHDAGGCGRPFCLPLWQAEALGPITGAPAVSNGQLYVGTQDGHIVAYRLPSP
jgi:hypothetical protein